MYLQQCMEFLRIEDDKRIKCPAPVKPVISPEHMACLFFYFLYKDFSSVRSGVNDLYPHRGHMSLVGRKCKYCWPVPAKEHFHP